MKQKKSRCNLEQIDVLPDDQIDTSEIPEISDKQMQSAVRGMFAPHDNIEVGRGKTKKVYRIIFDRESDGRWIAQIPDLPGVMAYGKTRMAAKIAVAMVFLKTNANP